MFYLKRQPHSTGEQVRINGHGLIQSLLMVALQKIPSRFFQLATSNNRNMCIRQRFVLSSTFAVFHCAGYVKIIESTRQISPTEYFISSASLVAAVVNLSASVISNAASARTSNFISILDKSLTKTFFTSISDSETVSI